MKYFSLIVSALSFSFIISCSSFQAGDMDGYYDGKKRADSDRDSVLQASRDRTKGNICEDEDSDHECKEMCSEIYDRRGDKKDCEELTTVQIEILYDLYELLEDPDEDNLQEIDPEDFDVYLNVSIASLEDLIDDEWNEREVKEFLYWMINDEEFTKIFKKEDDDYRTLTELLRKITRFDYSEIYLPFIKKIDKGERLMDIAIESGNEEALEWFMNYIEDKNSSCRDETVSRDCFEIYCKIGDKIDSDNMEDWTSYPAFESYIDDIIDDKINANNSDDSNYSNRGDGNGWNYGEDKGQIEDIDDINSDWVADLCGGLLTFF